MNEKYYISTGAQNCFYTLRHSWDEQTRDGVLERDYHICNLSTDADEAVAKAKAKIGQTLHADFSVNAIVRRQDIGWSVFQAGKYTGWSIHEVREENPEYLIWACENMAHSKAYAKTIELARALMAKELAEKAAKDAAAAAAEEKARRKAVADFAPIAQALEGMEGNFCQSVRADLLQGILPRGSGIHILAGIYGKAFGRRNSKAYNEAVDAFWRMVS